MTGVKKILIVDFDQNLQEILKEQLEVQGEFITDAANDGQTAIDKTLAQYYDVIIMEVGLTDIDGRVVCRTMREKGITSPIVILSKSIDDLDAISALDAGASDYVTKPFKFSLLIARLRARIRETQQSENAVFQIGRKSR